MRRELRWYDLFTVNAYFLGLTAISQTLVTLVLPLLIQRFVGEARQATYFGILRLWGLMLAVLVQALMGILSDRHRSPWGRRRPFVLIGTLGDLVCLTAMGFSAALGGMVGFWVLFAVYLLLQVFSNTAQAAV